MKRSGGNLVHAVETNRNVQWFTATNNLVLKVDRVEFYLENQSSLNVPTVLVTASDTNPSGLNNLVLMDANYAVFVDILDNPGGFLVKGSSVLQFRIQPFHHTILFQIAGRRVHGLSSTRDTCTHQVRWLISSAHRTIRRIRPNSFQREVDWV